jgi:NADH:ubiquinone oxidoreductase subunit F (NADH-binding)
VDRPERVLGPPCDDLAAYERLGGGEGLDVARKLEPDAVIEEVEASGLRGRGGAGFPTGRKWRTVAANRSGRAPTTVVVNAAEGEPGSFKDRAILRGNPYRILEGALIAARAVAADRVIVATKASFERELARLHGAAAELTAAGWTDGVSVEVVAGPGHYLYGEETALLEVLDGRQPFPRVAPPYRHGVDEVGDGTTSAAGVELAGPGSTTVAPPTLVNNVETLANVPGVLAQGPAWFRSVGTDDSPGTMVFTITGSTARHGVGELPLGTPLREVIERVGGGARPGRRIVAVLSGVSHPLLPAALVETAASYEALDGVGAGLGAAGFIVFDDSDDLAAVAAGVSRFLAVESCGQCTPCKQDGLALADLWRQILSGEADDRTLAEIADRAATVNEEARCFLAHQHQRVVQSVLRRFPDEVRRHLAVGGGGTGTGDATAGAPVLIAPIVDIVDGVARLDEREAAKQPDWTYDAVDSGQSPADRIDQGQALGST